MDKIIHKNLYKALEDFGVTDRNFLGLVRDILIISDYKKYFKDSYSNDWAFFTDEENAFFEIFWFRYC